MRSIATVLICMYALPGRGLFVPPGSVTICESIFDDTDCEFLAIFDPAHDDFWLSEFFDDEDWSFWQDSIGTFDVFDLIKDRPPPPSPAPPPPSM